MSKIMATGMMASRFGETTENFQGNKKAAAKTDSTITKLVARSYATLKKLAKDNSASVEDVAKVVLEHSQDELTKYIRGKGEVPNQTVSGVIAQAALLRMEDIATISAATDLTEDDALHEMEAAESEAVELNTPDKENILSPDIQASLNVIINSLLNRMEKKTGVSDIKSTMSLVRQKMATPLNSVKNPDNAIGDILFPSGQLPTTPPNIQAGSGATMNPDDSSTSIWDILDGIANAAAAVAGAVKSIGNTTTNTAQTVGGIVNQAGGGAVSSGLSQYMAKNWMTIVFVLIAIVLLIILLVRATGNRK